MRKLPFVILSIGLVWNMSFPACAEDGFTQGDRELLMNLTITVKELEKRNSLAREEALKEELKRLQQETGKHSKALPDKLPLKTISTLILTCNVEGAAVYIDKQKSPGESNVWIYRGLIPFETQVLEPGHHIVKLTKPGYDDVVENIEVISGRSAEIKLWMRPSRPREKGMQLKENGEDDVHRHDFGA